MGMKKPSSLKTAFWRFLFMLLGGLFGAVAVPFLLVTVSTTLGLTTYGDYSEIRANELAPILAATPDLSDVQIPMGIEYALLDKNYQLIETTLDETELEQAMRYATTGASDQNLQKRYLLITRENEYVVLQYYIGAQYTNEWMNEHLPSPDILLIVLIAAGGIFVCLLLTTRFAKKLRLQLVPLFEATSEVAKQNLDFEVGHSNIKEFEDVLISFSHMKESLKASLEQQWKAEQMQKEQIAALAHDLKTPLTVIQGNADLISETELDEEQRLYTEYISSSSEQMQLYIRTLIDISRATTGYQLHMEDIDLPAYVEQLRGQVAALCQTKKIGLQIEIESLPAVLSADKLLMERAIMNVVNNALDYSPQGSHISILIAGDKRSLKISVTDAGPGFSQEDLLHAEEQFYMADRSRSSNLHFGMGLFITKSIVRQHGGQLILSNSEKTGGAQVTILIFNIR
ncbi:MAG: HAMP domain-containing histidine kinase [Lachnospiraceae bacterium]|uniref:sensor histidine kinase n=1 Tax=Luxibacter massiliensis TaxID=2219695 RepID=UPI000F04A95C|nr:HAMP domain-containing sensor histidine kinase [Luxibacter massiliensis]MBS5398603.1 HAMP domain-containing histidine kinase [Lachnospiraceae bacterium]